MGWKKDFYTPRYPKKYLGDVNNIIYRSSWEHYAFKFCDGNPNILRWSSEEIAIPYLKPNPYNPSQMKKSNYFPDLYVELIDVNGELQKALIEIKPDRQTKASKSRNLKTKEYENYTYLVNQLKWEAAEQYCRYNGMDFMLLTEEGLYKSNK